MVGQTLAWRKSSTFHLTTHHHHQHIPRIQNRKMSTLLPPKAKRVKREELQRAREQQAPDLVPDDVPNVVIQLRASDTGTQLGGELHIPGNASAQQLDQLVNKLLGSVCFFSLHLQWRRDMRG